MQAFALGPFKIRARSWSLISHWCTTHRPQSGDKCSSPKPMSFDLLNLHDRIQSALRAYEIGDIASDPPISFRGCAWATLCELICQDLKQHVGGLRGVLEMLDLDTSQLFASEDETEKFDPVLIWLWGTDRKKFDPSGPAPEMSVGVPLVIKVLDNIKALAGQVLRLKLAQGLLGPEAAKSVKRLFGTSES